MKSITDTIMEIDWEALQEQKAWLLMSDSEAAYGLVSLIDAIQDSVVDNGFATELTVFNLEP